MFCLFATTLQKFFITTNNNINKLNKLFVDHNLYKTQIIIIWDTYILTRILVIYESEYMHKR